MCGPTTFAVRFEPSCCSDKGLNKTRDTLVDDAGGHVTSRAGEERNAMTGQSVDRLELSWPSHSSGSSAAVFPAVEVPAQQEAAGLGVFQVTRALGDAMSIVMYTPFLGMRIDQ